MTSVFVKKWKDEVRLPCLGGPFCGEPITQKPADAKVFYVERVEAGTDRTFWSAYYRRTVGLKLWRWAVTATDGRKLYYTGPGTPKFKPDAKVTLEKVVEKHELWVWEQEETDVPDGADAERGGTGDAG